jgi:hypothetical protein
MKNKQHKMNVSMPQEIFLRLQLIAIENKCTLSDVVQHAMSLECWFNEIRKQGYSLSKIKEDNIWQMNFPYKRRKQ